MFGVSLETRWDKAGDGFEVPSLSRRISYACGLLSSGIGYHTHIAPHIFFHLPQPYFTLVAVSVRVPWYFHDMTV